MTPIVFLHLIDTRHEGGVVEAGYSLEHGVARAALAESGIAAQQFVDPEPATFARLVRRLRDTGAETFVFTPGALAERCARALAARVLWSCDELGLTGTPSPYLAGAIPPAVAARVGVDAGTEHAVAELAWIDGHTVEPQVVPLLGDVRPLLDAIAEAGLRRVRPTATFDLEIADPVLIARAAAAGFAAVRIRVHDRAETLATLADAAAAHGIELTASLALDAQTSLDALEDVIIAVADTGVPFEHDAVPPGLVVPELQLSTTFRRTTAAQRRLVGRLRRAQEGLYPRAAFADATCELVWEHDDPPTLHEDWLAEIVGFDSALFTIGAPSDGWVISDASTVERLETGWRIDGTTIELERYARARDLVPSVPVVLLVDEPEDVEAFLADADEARRTGAFRPAFAHPLSTIRDVARWSGESPPLALPRLVVDRDGVVRAAHAGPPIGTIGDSFAELRARARECTQSFVLPAWLAPETYDAQLRERPWLPRYVAVMLAVRTLTGRHPELLTADGLASLRVSGFGGPLVYDGEVAHEAAGVPLLVAVGGERYLFDPAGARVARCASDLAAIFEGLVGGGADAMRSWLERTRALTPEQSLRGLRAAAAQLQSVGMLSAELQAAVA